MREKDQMQAVVTFVVHWGAAKAGFQSFLRAESGATAMEYALLASGIAIGIIVAVASLGGSVEAMFDEIGAAVKF